jgi:hypothetical protein
VFTVPGEIAVIAFQHAMRKFVWRAIGPMFITNAAFISGHFDCEPGSVFRMT